MSKMLFLISSYSYILISHGSATLPSASQCLSALIILPAGNKTALKPPAAAAATCVAVRGQFHGTGGEVWQLLTLLWGPLVKRRNSSTTPTLHAVRLVRQKKKSLFVCFNVNTNRLTWTLNICENVENVAKLWLFLSCCVNLTFKTGLRGFNCVEFEWKFKVRDKMRVWRIKNQPSVSERGPALRYVSEQECLRCEACGGRSKPLQLWECWASKGNHTFTVAALWEKNNNKKNIHLTKHAFIFTWQPFLLTHLPVSTDTASSISSLQLSLELFSCNILTQLNK